MINYFNFQKFKNKYLITNDLGRYDFLDVSQFRRLLTDNLPTDSEEGKRLREKNFVYDSDDEQFAHEASLEIFNIKIKRLHRLYAIPVYVFFWDFYHLILNIIFHFLDDHFSDFFDRSMINIF